MKKEFSPEEENEIIEYYKSHSNNDTARFFHVHFRRVAAILASHDIKEHSKEENAALWKQAQRKRDLERYGVEHHLQANAVKEKRKQTNLRKYGAENVFSSDEIQEKIRQTNIERYGAENYSSTADCRKKVNETNKNRHGNVNIGRFGSKEHGIAMVEKYGAKYFSQTAEWARKARKRYEADGNSFDSLPELAFYLWHKENGFDVKRASARLKYEFEGKTHYYFPDFEICGKLYEIKGSQFLSESGKWKSPYENDRGKYEAKRQCALRNGVAILYEDDYKKYVTWFYEAGYYEDNFKKRNNQFF